MICLKAHTAITSNCWHVPADIKEPVSRLLNVILPWQRYTFLIGLEGLKPFMIDFLWLVKSIHAIRLYFYTTR